MSNRTRERPRIDVPRTFFDYIGEILSVVGIVAAVALLTITWADLPGEVPRHFGFSGDPTAWADRWTIIFPIGIAVLFYVGLTFLGRFPHVFNYVVQITEQNAPIQYRLARSMIIWMKALLIWMFVLIVWSQIRVASGDDDSMNALLVGGVLVGIHVVLGIYIYRSLRWRDGPPEDERNVLDRSRKPHTEA